MNPWLVIVRVSATVLTAVVALKSFEVAVGLNRLVLSTKESSKNLRI